MLHAAVALAREGAPAPAFGEATLRLAIDLDEWADPERVVVALDGAKLSIGRDTVAVAVSVDAGTHLITVSVGPDVVWSRQVILLPGDDEVVEIAPEMAEVPVPLPAKKSADPDDAPWPREFVLRPPTLKAGMVSGAVSIASVFADGKLARELTVMTVRVGILHNLELGGNANVCFAGWGSCARLHVAGVTVRGRVLRRGNETLTLRGGLQSAAVTGSDERTSLLSAGASMRTHSRNFALAVNVGTSSALGDRSATRWLGGNQVGASVARQAGRRLAFAAGAGLFVPHGVDGAYVVTLTLGAFFSVSTRVDFSVDAIRPLFVGPNTSGPTVTELAVGVVARY